MRTVSLKLPESLLTSLDTEARARGVSKSALMRESLEKELRRKSLRGKSCYDLSHDLIGSIEGLPADLATNPDYMEGFGR